MAVTTDPSKTGISETDALALTGTTLAPNVVNASLNSITPTGGTLAVTGSISAGTLEIVGGIQSLASVTITKDGSDSIGSGALMQVRNAGATRSWVQQLSASNNLDWWHLDGSWAKYMTLSTAGVAVTGSISATAGVEGADFRAYTADNAAGGAGVNTASVAFANGGAVKARIRSAVYGDGYMAFHVNDDTERMRLTSTGLAVNGPVSVIGGSYISPSAGQAYIYSSNALGLVAHGRGSTSDITLLNGDGTEVARVPTLTTNLLIGQTTNPSSYKLAVTGNVGVTGGYIAGEEQTAPAAPAANGYRIFAQDNGAGKTQLMVIFASGAAQQIAIEP